MLYTLAAKAVPTPSATGTSMPSVRRLKSRQAPMKKGQAEYSTTGIVSTRLAQLISRRISSVMSVAV